MTASPSATSQSLDSWAEETARSMLADMGARLSQVLAVGEKSRELALGLDESDGQVLIASAYLHDISYTEQLVATGLHQIDGARWLTDQGLTSVASMVAHHSEARVELELRGRQDLLEPFERPDQLLADVLTYCDVTTGPIGQDVSLDGRIEDVGQRRGTDSPVYRAMVVARERYEEAIERTLDLLADQSNVASALREVVVEPAADGRRDLEVGHLLPTEPPHIVGLVAAQVSVAPDWLAGEAHAELLSDLPVVVRDHVSGVAVDTDKADRPDLDAGLLANLTDDALGD